MSGVTPEGTQEWMPAVGEYFTHYAAGVWDAGAYLQIILPSDKAYIVEDRSDLVIGHAGVDGIEFCLRQGQMGVFAWYGIDAAHLWLAPDIRSLLAGWKDGSITV